MNPWAALTLKRRKLPVVRCYRFVPYLGILATGSTSPVSGPGSSGARGDTKILASGLASGLALLAASLDEEDRSGSARFAGCADVVSASLAGCFGASIGPDRPVGGTAGSLLSGVV